MRSFSFLRCLVLVIVVLAGPASAVALASPHHPVSHHVKHRRVHRGARRTRVAHTTKVSAATAAVKRHAPVKPVVKSAPVKIAPVAIPTPAPTTPAPTATTPAPTTTTPAPTPAPTTPAPTTPAPTPTTPAPATTAPAAPVITGTTYYVSPTGSDQNTGTSPAQAWKTVGRVNNQALAPGDGVLFQGGATFSDSDLEPARSGTPTSPILYGSYGTGQATITKGAWFVQDNLVLNNLQFQATVYGGSSVQGASNNDTIQNCTITLPAGNSSLGLYTNGNHWTIANNTITNTGLSGLLLNGDTYQITNNTINQTGLDTTVAYNAHGIYLDASNATITANTITNSAESAISVRYRNSTITHNTLTGAQIGIDFYQTDPTAGTANWTANTISHTTAADLYVSSDGAYTLHESFTITNNTLTHTTGVYTNLTPTTGTYTLTNNQNL